MLFPQFTIKRLLLLTAGCAVLFLVMSLALRGQVWAMAISIGVLSLVVAAIFYALAFVITWPLAEFFDFVSKQKKPTAPFAQYRPAPKLLTPEEPTE